MINRVKLEKGNITKLVYAIELEIGKHKADLNQKQTTVLREQCMHQKKLYL